MKGRGMKTAKDYLKEANSVVEKISPAEGIERHNSGNLVVVDVRDSSAFPETGTVKGALRIPRGLIEFFADDTHPMHNSLLKKDAHRCYPAWQLIPNCRPQVHFSKRH